MPLRYTFSNVDISVESRISCGDTAKLPLVISSTLPVGYTFSESYISTERRISRGKI